MVSRHVGKNRASRARGRFGALTACVLIASIPSAGFALGAFDRHLPLAGVNGAVAQFTPSSVDPRMAALVARAATSNVHLMRFTPAGVPDRAGRSVTVAVRVDAQAARMISAHSAIAEAKEQAGAGTLAELRLAPMPYNLGLARGYQSFAKPVTPTPSALALPHPAADAGLADLSYKVAPAPREDSSRFTPKNTVSEPRAAAAPRAIEARDPSAPQALDVAGSYRLTRNFDVTAGVRYSQQRDRLAPVVDTAKQDSQAVYIGTQFHF